MKARVGLGAVLWFLAAPSLLSQAGLSTDAGQRKPFKIVLTGDSTTALEGGWGPGFCAILTPNVTCVDLAQNGRSTVSFVDEGWWKKALDEKGQYYFIQFGHNDQKPDPKRHADADGLYSENLHRFIHEVRAIGGIPIILSPLSRRNYKDGKLEKDGLEQYAAAARKVAAEEKVTFVDLFSLSQSFLATKTQAEADEYNATTHPDARAENGSTVKPDRTHLNEKGKAVFGRMVADSVVRSQAELRPNVKALPEGATPVLTQSAPADGH